jgi:hypothetical protein
MCGKYIWRICESAVNTFFFLAESNTSAWHGRCLSPTTHYRSQGFLTEFEWEHTSEFVLCAFSEPSPKPQSSSPAAENAIIVQMSHRQKTAETEVITIDVTADTMRADLAWLQSLPHAPSVCRDQAVDAPGSYKDPIDCEQDHGCCGV